MPEGIIKKIKKANLVGRGGACYPTASKWQAVLDATRKMKKDEKKCYVVCNASEGEPGVKKDFYILKKHAKEVISGMKLAQELLSADRGFLYLNPDYYPKLKESLKKIIRHYPISVIRKSHRAGYIGGEETSVINGLEKKRIEPRLRPPYPVTNGLYDAPTLVNNVETFYDISLINAGKYENKRFFTINGDCLHTGVYELPEDWTVSQVLKETNNYPKFEFFVQVGGDGSGVVLNSKQLDRAVSGSASITIYSVLKHQPMDLIRNWIAFFTNESCGQCTPCREGTYRIRELLNDNKINWQMVADILDTLSDSSFCGLGCAAPIAVESFVNNVLPSYPKENIELPASIKRYICECFK